MTTERNQPTHPSPYRHISCASEFGSQSTLCHATGEPLGDSDRPETPRVKLPTPAPVAQGIEHRFPKPLSTSGVPQPVGPCRIGVWRERQLRVMCGNLDKNRQPRHAHVACYVRLAGIMIQSNGPN